MTPEEAAALLRPITPRKKVTAEERLRRGRFRANAQSQAHGALARLHPDEYSALYQAALAQIDVTP